MLIYPALIEADGDGYCVHFPDIPEALTSATSPEAAVDMAKDALATAMEFYFEDHRCVPMPGKVGPGQVAIPLPASLSAKVLLLNELLAQGISNAELARRLHVRPQEVNRITDLGHATKIDTIAAALGAVGRRLELRVRRASPPAKEGPDPHTPSQVPPRRTAKPAGRRQA